MGDFMVDTEFNEFKNKVIISVIVIILFIIPLTVFVFKTYGYKESEVLDRINNREDMVLLLRSRSCDYCDNIISILDDNGISCEVVMNTDDRYNDIVKSLDIPRKDIILPELVEVKDGDGIGYVVDIKNKEAVLEFIKYMDKEVLNSK